ncbi:DUF4158 domain-containing protein [Actinoplanes campanulatus]|uniref:DUF4158 domain-containing protein n=1 Tax=Actinoplanes campanulatus TaxID=113559 RepID=UPI001941AB6A
MTPAEGAVYGRFTGPCEQAVLDRFFFLDDADRNPIASQRGDHNRLGVQPSIGDGSSSGPVLGGSARRHPGRGVAGAGGGAVSTRCAGSCGCCAR